MKSQNDVLWFCLVLLVEVFGLSVALGGPWIEVSYFLLVVISQTIAGAYIWAQLRKDELRLPIPELLAMGFAIGSSSAAISQLFLRDLLGVRLMISPFVPIIAVAIWLIFKRSPRLAVEITHTDSTTLLWLLFPAPLALTQYSYPTFIFFVVPLFLLALFFNSKKFHLNLVSIFVLPFILLISFVLGSFINLVSNNGSGISRIISDDSRFDLAHSVGTAKWGITSNIEFANQTFSYYKISYLWGGPILSPLGINATDLVDFAIPIFLLCMIGLAIWSFSFRLTKSDTISNLAAVLAFTVAALPDAIQMNLRILHLIGLIFMLTVAISLLATRKFDSIFNVASLIFGGFLVAGTRFSFLYQVIPVIFVAHSNSAIRLKNLSFALKTLFLYFTGVFIALVLFSFEKGSTLYNRSMLSASAWPINPLDSIRFLIVSTIGFTLPILLVKKFSANDRRTNSLTIFSLAILFGCQVLVPHLFLRDTDFLISFLLITSPIAASTLVNSKKKIRECKINSPLFFALFIAIGFAFRISYDRFSRSSGSSRKIDVVLNRLVSNDLILNVIYLMTVLAITALLFLFLSTKKSEVFKPLLIVTLYCASFGVSIGSFLNPIIDSLFHGEKLTDSKVPLMVERWNNQDRNTGLDFAKLTSSNDDIFASNFGLFRDDGFYDDYRAQLKIERQFYLAARYSYIYKSFPEIFRDELLNARHDSDEVLFRRDLIIRFNTSIDFSVRPSGKFLQNMLEQNVKWFIVDLERTSLRDWEPWATTRFINDKVAILELATEVKS